MLTQSVSKLDTPAHFHSGLLNIDNETKLKLKHVHISYLDLHFELGLELHWLTDN